MTSLTVTRTIEKDRTAVWKAWTDASELAAWMWPPSFATACDVDLRVGGAFRLASDTAGMAVGGEYLEIDEPARLVFTWRWDGEDEESLVTLTLSETAGGTELVLVHDRFTTEESRDSHAQGWNDCLDRLPGFLGA